MRAADPANNRVATHGSWLFCLGTIGPALLLVVPVVGFGVSPGALQLLYPLVAFAPVTVAFALSSAGGPREMESWLLRFRPRLALLPWYLAAVVALPATAFLALRLGEVLFLGEPATLPAHGKPWYAILAASCVMIVIPGITEESGWRGYLQPRLAARWGPLLASLTVGVVWGLWHSTDLVMHPDRFTPLTYAPKFAWIVSASLVLGWMVHHSRGGIPVAILGHLGGNLMFLLAPIAPWRGADPRIFWLASAINLVLGMLLFAAAQGRRGTGSRGGKRG